MGKWRYVIYRRMGSLTSFHSSPGDANYFSDRHFHHNVSFQIAKYPPRYFKVSSKLQKIFFGAAKSQNFFLMFVAESASKMPNLAIFRNIPWFFEIDFWCPVILLWYLLFYVLPLYRLHHSKAEVFIVWKWLEMAVRKLIPEKYPYIKVWTFL